MTTKPNFFIIGAAKSGTSSLADYLNQHPDIFISPLKEPFYFVNDSGYNDYNKYISLFNKSNNEKAVGEASTGYLFDKFSAKLIYKFNKEAKIIAILRNPSTMAFSYWQYMKLIGNESKSFMDAISPQERVYRHSDKFKNECVNWWASYLYVERALYYEQIRRYYEIFNPEQIKIFIYEEFFKEKELSCRDCYQFLNVEDNFKPVFTRKNMGGSIRFKCIRSILNTENAIIRNITKKIIPIKARNIIKDKLISFNTNENDKKIMNNEEKKILNDLFQKDIYNLEKLLNRKIDTWHFKYK
ncbi:MAG: hypothetical protein C4575_11000 [Desulforudis sp.]|jgi:hypothetical protein|nr:MAG: hypothetical protein C4575_11000 [Desulforudis sp.]